jgi:hypothetical protein
VRLPTILRIRRDDGRRIPTPSAAVVIATLALFVALGGTVHASTLAASKPVIGINDNQMSKEIELPAHTRKVVDLSCPAGDFAVNGGFDLGTTAPTIVKSASTDDFSKWEFDVVNASIPSVNASISLAVDCFKLLHAS